MKYEPVQGCKMDNHSRFKAEKTDTNLETPNAMANVKNHKKHRKPRTTSTIKFTMVLCQAQHEIDLMYPFK